MRTESFTQIQHKLREIFFEQELIHISRIFDFVGAVEGVKPVSRIVTNESYFEKLQESCAILGVYIARSPFKLRLHRSALGGIFLSEANTDDENAEKIYIYISKDSALIDETIQLDTKGGKQDAISIQRMGRLFGYPDCCIDNYNKFLLNNEERLYVQLERTPIKKSYYFYNNKLCTLFGQLCLITDMYPCSFACANAAKLAKGLLEAATTYFPDFSSEVLSGLRRPILLINIFVFQFLIYAVNSNSLEYDSKGMSLPNISQNVKEIIMNNNKIVFTNNELLFHRDKVCTAKMPVKRNPIKEGGARLFIFDSDLD